MSSWSQVSSSSTLAKRFTSTANRVLHQQARFSLVTAVPVVLVLMLGSFWAGNALYGQVWNPLVPKTQKLDLTQLNNLYGLMQRYYDGPLNASQLLTGAEEGMVAAAGDPYTDYLTAADAKALNDDLSGSLSGIGAEVGIKNNAVTVIAPVAGSPADKAGLKPGDVIAGIDGQNTSGMTLDQAVAKIRGKAGTKVTLIVVRGSQSPLTLTITRADLTVPSVTWSMKSGNIGYIDISTFGTDTAALMDKAAGELKSQGAKSIILDLRNDGGGYLTAGQAVANEFLPAGKTIVSERTGNKTVSTITSTDGGQLVGMPTIVLINGGSASASEIVSGALHDNKAAKLLGEQSFGKGSVQEIEDLPQGAELKVTVAHWYTPGGVNINKKGLTPDIKVALTTADYNASRDPQLDAAIKALQ